MKKIYRIKKYSEIDAVYKNKKARHSKFFGLYQLTDQTMKHFRFAISIGKKYGNAVERNLMKRRIRMIICEYAMHIQKDKNILIVVKPKSNTLSFKEIKKDIFDLLKKSNVLEIKDAKTL